MRVPARPVTRVGGGARFRVVFRVPVKLRGRACCIFSRP
jgi:hypothetical protein